MFDVLVYLYEHYWRPEAFPEEDLLTRKLSAVGFEAEEITDALAWLKGMAALAANQAVAPRTGSVRVFAPVESHHIGMEGLGYLSFLESAGVLDAMLREVIVDRLMAIEGGPVALEDLKVIVLMALWTTGAEPDSLVLDELFSEEADRAVH